MHRLRFEIEIFIPDENVWDIWWGKNCDPWEAPEVERERSQVFLRAEENSPFKFRKVNVEHIVTRTVVG